MLAAGSHSGSDSGNPGGSTLTFFPLSGTMDTMPRTRITNADLQQQVNTLNRITGNPLQGYTPTSPNGMSRALIGHYYIDAAYGGVKLVQIVNPYGGVTEPLGGGYTTRRDLYGRIGAMLAGVRVVQENPKICLTSSPL